MREFLIAVDYNNKKPSDEVAKGVESAQQKVSDYLVNEDVKRITIAAFESNENYNPDPEIKEKIDEMFDLYLGGHRDTADTTDADAIEDHEDKEPS